MKTLFDKSTRDELVQRINSINENNKAVWGKMNVSQMLKHCTKWNEWVLGTKAFVYKQNFIGKIFGKMALKNNTKDAKPIGKNMPAGKTFTIKEKVEEITTLKSIWIEQIKFYENYSNDNFIHDFFGNMTNEQIGIFAFKHNDHHLRQFNA